MNTDDYGCHLAPMEQHRTSSFHQTLIILDDTVVPLHWKACCNADLYT